MAQPPFSSAAISSGDNWFELKYDEWKETVLELMTPVNQPVPHAWAGGQLAKMLLTHSQACGRC